MTFVIRADPIKDPQILTRLERSFDRLVLCIRKSNNHIFVFPVLIQNMTFNLFSNAIENIIIFKTFLND